MQEHLPAEKLQEAQRLLYGLNQGAPVAPLALGEEVRQAAEVRCRLACSRIPHRAGPRIHPCTFDTVLGDPSPLPASRYLMELQAGGFDVQAHRFAAAPEQLRPPRVVRVGLVQHSIQAPTTAPFAEQLEVSSTSLHSPRIHHITCFPMWQASWCRQHQGPCTQSDTPTCSVGPLP